MKKLALHWQIFIGLLLAIPFGLMFGEQGIWDATPIFSFIGKMFIQGLKMLIVPLIASAIITGIASLGNEGGFARLGLKTIGFYSFSSLLAILLGLFLVNLIQPGIADGQPVKDLIGLEPLSESVSTKISGKSSSDIWAVFLRMVPTNIVSAAANGQMLGIITFCLLFGFFMMKIDSPYRESIRNFWEGMYQVMMKLTDFIMKFAPIGVFALVAKTISTTGFSAFQPLLWFFLTVCAALALHMFGSMPILLLSQKLNPKKHIQAMSPALLTAFSTSSSAATLPKTMDCIQERAGVSPKVSSFTLPLGATVNMDGTALYECVAAMFIAQAYGLDLTIAIQIKIVIVALLTSIGVAGIPSASLVAISLILASIGLPAEGIGLILVVDRVLDMFRTTVNVFSDSCAAAIIAKSEGEEILR